MVFISFFLFIFVAASVFLKIAELFLPQDKQESFKQSLMAIECEIKTKGENWTVLSPLYYLSSLLDRYFGERLISRRSIYLTSIATGILIITTIWSITTLTSKGDFLERSPIRIWRQNIENIKKNNPNDVYSKQTTTIKNDPDVQKFMLRANRRRDMFVNLNDSVGAIIIYTSILLLFCVATVVTLSSLTLAITRQILREMMHAKGIFTLLGGVIVNCLLIILLGSFFGLILFLVSDLSLSYNWEVLVALFARNLTLSLISYTVGSILSAFLLPGWIKLVIILSLAPIILLLFSLLLSIGMFLFKKPIHLSLVILLRRALEWKAGPIAFLAAFDGLFALIFTWLYKCLA